MLLKKIKIISFLLLLFICTKVQASSLIRDECIKTEKLREVGQSMDDSYIEYVCLLSNSEDNHLLYRITPYKLVSLKNELSYNNTSNQEELDDDILEKISILISNGYLQNDHTDIKWYSATQYSIFNIQKKTNEYLYYVSMKNYERVNIYTEEISYLEDILNNYNITTEVSLNKGEEYVFPVDDYTITNIDDNVSIKDGYYHIKVINSKTYTLERGTKPKYKILYDNTKNIQYIDVTPSNYNKKTLIIKRKDTTVNININNNTKVDSDTTYILKNSNKDIINTYKEGNYTLNLPKDIYTLEMNNNPTYIKKDTNIYSIDLLNNDEYSIDINVDYLTYKYKLTLLDNNGNTLKGISLNIKGTLNEYKVTSNKNGLIDIELPQDTYEITCLEDNYKLDKITLNLDKDREDTLYLEKQYLINIESNLDTNVCLDDYCLDTIDKKISFYTTGGLHTMKYKNIDGYSLKEYSKDITVARGRTIKLNYEELPKYNIEFNSNIDTTICMNDYCKDTYNGKVIFSVYKDTYNVKIANIEGYTTSNDEYSLNVKKDKVIDINYVSSEEIEVPNTKSYIEYYIIPILYMFILKFKRL